MIYKAAMPNRSEFIRNAVIKELERLRKKNLSNA